MAEALEKVKMDLGRGAVILHTRTVRRGGLMGVGARSVVEITASRDPALLTKAERAGVARTGGTAACDPGSHGLRRRKGEAASMHRPGGRSLPSSDSPEAPGFEALAQISSSTGALRSEMEELRTMVRQLLDSRHGAQALATPPVPAGSPQTFAPIPEELRDYYTRLIQNAVADELAREVIARAKERLNDWRSRSQPAGLPVQRDALRDSAGSVNARGQEPLTAGPDFQRLIPSALLEVIERMLPSADPVRLATGKGTKFVALIGPTGVGKTTTIAKLAAQFKLRDRKRVGLITTDTYRIAAVAQLKAYADILSVPLEVVYAPQELGDTMRRMNGFDVVLIDTSGRSQNDSEHLEDLQAFLAKAREFVGGCIRPVVVGDEAESTAEQEGGPAAAETADSLYRPLETHLVLSCTAHSSQLRQVIERFSPVGVDRIVFTKLDEAVGVGVILNIAHRLDVQLSYLTTGQDVPDDIEVGNRRRIAELVLDLPSAAVRGPDTAVPSPATADTLT